MKIKTLLTILTLSAFSLTSCVDEVDYGFESSFDGISFSVTESNVWQDGNAASRGAATPSAPVAAGVYSLDRQDGTDKPLYLHSLVSDEFEKIETDSVADSRANTEAKYDNDNLFDHFGVSAFHYEGESGVSPKILIVKDIVKPNTDNNKVWDFVSTKRFWPNTGKVRFMSFYPSRSEQGNIYPREDITDEVIIDHTTPEMSHNQNDLMYAFKELSSPQKNSVKLEFKHAFTQVKFVMAKGMPEGRINYIKINNIRTKGSFHFPNGNSEYSNDSKCYWEYDENDDCKGTVKRNGDHYTPSGDDVTDISTNYKYVFLLLPQELNADTEVEVSFTERLSHPEFFAPGNTTSTEEFEQHAIIFKGKIGVDAQGNAKKWEMGTTVTYKISNNSIDITPTLEVSPDYTFSYLGGSDKFTITSKATISKTDGCSNDVEVPWVAEFIDDDNNAISDANFGYWLTNFPMQGSGSIKDMEFTVARPSKVGTEYVDRRPHSDWIKAQPEKEYTEDLSMRETPGKMTTANCYIINQAGTYKFPLVYGNGVKKGNENTEAYTYTGTLETGAFLKNFVNHRGDLIQSPYIYENEGCTPASVKLVWQDENLIKSYKLSDNNTYIEFTTNDPSSLAEGNAVIAVVGDDGNIMWSWHLWFTDYIPRKPAIIEEKYDLEKINPTDKKTYSQYSNKGVKLDKHVQEDVLMGVVLGWCSNFVRQYFERSVRVRVTQQCEGGLSQIVKIKQKEGVVNIGGNAPYYQFGRKDPMLPAKGSQYAPGGFANKTLVTGNYTTAKGKVDIKETIKNPFTFYTVTAAEGDWCNTHYNNLWSANIADKKDILVENFQDIKTIYDPCPVGYEVPDLYVFTFTTPDVGDENKVSRKESDWFEAMNTPFHGAKNTHTELNFFYDNLGMVFYCHEMKGVGDYDSSLGVAYFPALGARTYGGGVLTYSWTDQRAYTWCSTPQFLEVDDKGAHPETYGSSFGLKKDELMPVVQNTRAIGNPIWPVVEVDYKE